MTQLSALPDLSHVIAMKVEVLNCSVEGTRSHEPQIQKGQDEILTAE
jgi:hypothetical protein